MKFLPFLVAACAALSAIAPVQADMINTFTDNPLVAGGSTLIQGPDAANVTSRFTYNAADHMLTAHYDSALPTVKLLFPLGGRHLTQDLDFSLSATFKILPAGFLSPADYGGSAPAFGLVNSATTGDLRGSSTDANYVEVTPGTCYDIMTVDYYPTQDFTYGGDTVSLSTFGSQQSGVSFFDSGRGGYYLGTLALDTVITTTVTYDAAAHRATLAWDGGSVSSNLTGVNFDMDAFAITLWQDNSLAPAPPAVSHGSRIAADVEFASISVTILPEPGTMALLACGALALVRTRVRRRI